MNRVLSDRPVVIVTDGNERSTLAVTRSLGARGIAVYVGAETSASLAGASKYCTRSFLCPSPWQAPEEYVACIQEQASFHESALIFPMTDLAVELLGSQQGRSGKRLTLPISSPEKYHALSDKYRLMRWAHEQGIPIPDTRFVPKGEVEDVLPSIDRWPVVVKPGRSLVRTRGEWRKTSVRYAENADALRRLYEEFEELREPSLVQSRIVGEGQGVFGLFVEGRAQALFAHRRLREKPPSGGVSVLRESIALPGLMTKYARAIAQSVDWNGVAMMEFKVDRQSGIPYLMEVNGRFWGSLQLAIDAGIDFPWLLYRFATTGVVPDCQPYKIGVKSRWWLGDLDHLLLRLRKSDKELNLLPGSPSRTETFKNFFSLLAPQAKSEVFWLGDLRPGFHEIVMYLLLLTRRVGPAGFSRLRMARLAAGRVIWDLGLGLGIHRARMNKMLSGGVETVLVLCKGNVCRSPFAAAFLQAQLKTRRAALEVVSAGIDTMAGKPAYPLARTTSIKYGIDLSRHRTTVISRDLVAKADLILVMELVHNQMLFELFPEARAKTFLLGHFSSDPVTDIQDPYGGTPEEFDRCYALISLACEGLLGHLDARQVTGGGSPSR